MLLAGRKILITGASSGLGAQFARSCARQGADIILAARRLDRLEALAREIGPQAHALALDVAEEASIEAAFDALSGQGRMPDVLINNAGLNAPGLAVDMTADDFDRVMNVNVRGLFLTARAFARRHIDAQRSAADPARIINIASIGGLVVLPGVAAYCASKAAVVMLSRSLAREWARKAINVNAICPGYIATEINADWLAEEGGQRMVAGFARRRLMDIGDLDGLIHLLAGPGGAKLTGSIFTADDGQSL